MTFSTDLTTVRKPQGRTGLLDSLNKSPRSDRRNFKAWQAEVLTSPPYNRQLETEETGKKKTRRTSRKLDKANKRQKGDSA